MNESLMGLIIYLQTAQTSSTGAVPAAQEQSGAGSTLRALLPSPGRILSERMVPYLAHLQPLVFPTEGEEALSVVTEHQCCC